MTKTPRLKKGMTTSPGTKETQNEEGNPCP